MRNDKQPKIHFEKFRDNWTILPMGKIAEITMGQSPDGATYSDTPKGFILVQGNADIENGLIKPKVWTTQKTKTADAGDLLITVRAPAGSMGKTNYPVVIGRGVAAIKGDEFLFQYLQKIYQDGYWSRVSAGSIFESINGKDLRELEIWMPSREEREEIGNYLKNIDSMIAYQRLKVIKLQNEKKSLLQKMFPEGNDEKPSLRFKGFTDAWEQRDVGDCLVSIPSKNFITEAKPSGKYPVYQQGDIPLAGYSDISPFRQENVILFGDHTLSLYRPEKPFLLATDGIKILKSNNFNNLFFKYYLEKYKPKSEGYKRHYSILIKKASYYTKSKTEQEKIGSIINYLDTLITLHQRKLF